MPWDKSKSFDGSALIGDWFPKNEFKDLNSLSFNLKLNDHVVQHGNTSKMLWKIDDLISYISQYFTLKIGDIIFTGTPAGVGAVSVSDVLVGHLEDIQAFSVKIK
jgi:2-keto-4-pentenoate hydratase/2-oxohepta-3-ene-1,7-dioic acid hydratase in catechol pathway